MRPKLILLLLLAIASVTFLAFMFTANTKTVCEKQGCPLTAPVPDSSGGGEMFEISLNHMIVSTIK